MIRRNRLLICWYFALMLFAHLFPLKFPLESLGPLGTILLPQIAQAIEIDFEQDFDGLPLVYMNLVIQKGSVSDPKNQAGLTNFMGEMLLRGTKTKSKDELDLALDQMGAKLRVETRAEALIFRGAVLSSKIEPYLKLFTEILTEPNFPEAEMDRLKRLMISSLEEELGSDASISSRKFTEFLFNGHPYGNPPIGKKKDILKFTKNDMILHYNRLFQNKLMMVIGTGNLSSERIKTWANDLVTLRTTTQVNNPLSSDESISNPILTDHRRLLIIDKPDRTQTQIHIGQMGILMTAPNFFPLYLGNYAFGGGSSFSSILMSEIRVKRGWSYGANSSFRFGLHPRSWIAHLFPAEKDTLNALSYSLSLIENLKKNGISQEQFEFAKQSLVNSSGFNFNTPHKRVENLVLEKTLSLPSGFIKSYGEQLKKVKLEQVNSALASFLQPEKLVISVLCTAQHLQAKLPQAAGVEKDQVQFTSYLNE